jgi:hypothetical protein
MPGSLGTRRCVMSVRSPIGAVREVRLEATQWASAPARHEGGTP